MRGYINTNALMSDLDMAVRAAEREMAKARNTLDETRRAVERGKTRNVAGQLAGVQKRLDKLQGAMQLPVLTQWRMEQAVPAEVRRYKPPGLPEGLRCKKCGEVKEPDEFLYDDHQGNGGHTYRCLSCRSPEGKRGAQRRAVEAYRQGLIDHPSQAGR